MADPIKVDFRAEHALKTRTVNLIMSLPAQMVRLRFMGISFYGPAFVHVARAIQSGDITFRTGQVEAEAGAHYQMDDDIIDVPDYGFGKDDFGREALVHECFHAWRDIQGRKALSDGGEVDTTALMDEAMAYIAGALYFLHDSRPHGPAAKPPPYKSKPVFARANAIALALLSKDNPVVPAKDAANLIKDVRSDPAYADLDKKPKTRYGNDGV